MSSLHSKCNKGKGGGGGEERKEIGEREGGGGGEGQKANKALYFMKNCQVHVKIEMQSSNSLTATKIEKNDSK